MVQNYNNLFVIIKNAILKKQNYVFIFYSKISLNIIKILKKHKFIRYYSIIVFKNKKNIKVYLKYSILGTESVQSIKKVASKKKKISLKKFDKKNELNSLILTCSKITNKKTRCSNGLILTSLY